MGELLVICAMTPPTCGYVVVKRKQKWYRRILSNSVATSNKIFNDPE